MVGGNGLGGCDEHAVDVAEIEVGRIHQTYTSGHIEAGLVGKSDDKFISECEFTGSPYPFIESIIVAATDKKFHRDAADAFMRLSAQ